MRMRLRGPCHVGQLDKRQVKPSIWSYNLPKTGVVLVSVLVESLVLGNGVLGVDETGWASVTGSRMMLYLAVSGARDEPLTSGKVVKAIARIVHDSTVRTAF